MIHRKLSERIKELATQFPVISLTGPRQSGKTTLSQLLFPDYAYVSLENPQDRELALENPVYFLTRFEQGVIVDEAQHAPELFSYIQGIVDKKKQMGQFILTGSQNFLLLEKITQSLAGRVALFHLLPLSYEEYPTPNKTLDHVLLRGMFPGLIDRKIHPQDFYPNYVQTYVERDVRQIINIKDLSTFQTFLKLCAGRIGQLLNYSSLANDCGVSHTTIREWISLLEASFIVYRLHPDHVHYNKRLVKSPKLYFYDTGLAAFLLSIQDEEQLATHYARGSLFENYVMSEVVKHFINQNRRTDMSFWRDKTGLEVDLLIQRGINRFALEVKATMTPREHDLETLRKYMHVTKQDIQSALIHGGDKEYDRSDVAIRSWRCISQYLHERVE